MTDEKKIKIPKGLIFLLLQILICLFFIIYINNRLSFNTGLIISENGTFWIRLEDDTLIPAEANNSVNLLPNDLYVSTLHVTNITGNSDITVILTGVFTFVDNTPASSRNIIRNKNDSNTSSTTLLFQNDLELFEGQVGFITLGSSTFSGTSLKFGDIGNNVFAIGSNADAPIIMGSSKRQFIGFGLNPLDDGNQSEVVPLLILDNNTLNTNISNYAMAQSGFCIDNYEFCINKSAFSFGQLYVNGGSETVDIISKDVWANVTFENSINLKGFSNYANVSLSADYTGTYLIMHSLSFSDGALKSFESSVAVNGVVQSNCYTTRRLNAAGDVGNTGSPCLVNLTRGDNVTAIMRNLDNNQDATIQSGSLVVKGVA